MNRTAKPTRFLPDPDCGEIRRNDYGRVQYLGEADGFVAVWQMGTNHNPFFMPLEEWERLPKVDK